MTTTNSQLETDTNRDPESIRIEIYRDEWGNRRAAAGGVVTPLDVPARDRESYRDPVCCPAGTELIAGLTDFRATLPTSAPVTFFSRAIQGNGDMLDIHVVTL